MQDVANPLSPRFQCILATVPRVSARGDDHTAATRMWIALHRWTLEQDAEEEAAQIRNDLDVMPHGDRKIVFL